MAANVIRNIRQMPFLHRGEGFCPLERMREQRFWRLIVSCLTVLVGLRAGHVTRHYSLNCSCERNENACVERR